jgi:foldase protein PrsA
MSTIYTQQKQSDDYQQWLSDYQDNAEIVINDMPSNVPYNVDLTLYQSDDSEDSDEEGETSDETSEDATDETTEDSGTQETSVADELSAVEAGTTSEE